LNRQQAFVVGIAVAVIGAGTTVASAAAGVFDGFGFRGGQHAPSAVTVSTAPGTAPVSVDETVPTAPPTTETAPAGSIEPVVVTTIVYVDDVVVVTSDPVADPVAAEGAVDTTAPTSAPDTAVPATSAAKHRPKKDAPPATSAPKRKKKGGGTTSPPSTSPARHDDNDDESDHEDEHENEHEDENEGSDD
jgi:hypothetical protein